MTRTAKAGWRRSRAGAVGLAVAVYALVAGLSLAADRWDPLGDRTASVVTLASLGLGLLVGPWRAALFPALLPFLALFSP